MSSQADYAGMMKFMMDSGYTCTGEWLDACIEWVKETHSNSQITNRTLKNELFSQWLDADLMEMESRCLPPNLSQQKVTTLKGRFGLQVNSIQDIGESSYTQYNKLKKLENENTSVAATDSNYVPPSWEPKPRRCLYMVMTDGSQQVHGMEYVSIQALNLTLKPGVKVMINGPVECRLGVLLLKTTHITVLGGEVESLASTNSLENMLSRDLNRPNPGTRRNDGTNRITIPSSSSATSASVATQPILPTNDFDDDDDFLMDIDIDETILFGQTQGTQNSITQNPNPSQSSSTATQRTTSSNTSQRPSSTVATRNKRFQSPLLPNSVITSHTSDSRQQGVFRSTTSQPQTQRLPASQTVTKKFRPPTLRDSMEDSDEEDSAYPSRGFKSARSEFSKQQKISSYLKPVPSKLITYVPSKVRREPIQTEAQTELMETEVITLDSSSLSQGFDSDTNTTDLCNTVEVVEDEPILVHSEMGANSKSPFIYIQQINRGLFSVGEVVRVKGTISTLVSNIKIEDGKWTISVNVNDGSGYMVAKLTPQVLNGIIGFNPTEMKRLKASKTPQAKSKIMNGMKKLTTTLVHLNAIICVRIAQPESVITSFEEIAEYHVSELRKRVNENRTCTL